MKLSGLPTSSDGADYVGRSPRQLTIAPTVLGGRSKFCHGICDRGFYQLFLSLNFTDSSFVQIMSRISILDLNISGLTENESLFKSLTIICCIQSMIFQNFGLLKSF